VEEPSAPGPEQEPYEPPTYEPPPEPDEYNGVNPYERGNPHHESMGNHGGPDHGGPGGGFDRGHGSSGKSHYSASPPAGYSAGGTHSSHVFGNSIKCDADLASCVEKCVARAMYCWAAKAAHPYTDDPNGCYMGDLERCSEGATPASRNGVYSCNYRYPNGDYCKFQYGTKAPHSPVILCDYFLRD
jgi:hypothetical protein